MRVLVRGRTARALPVGVVRVHDVAALDALVGRLRA